MAKRHSDKNIQLSAAQVLGKGSTSFIFVSKQVKCFYIDEMHKILKVYKRGKVLSFLLLAIYFIQLLGLLLTSEMISKLSEASNNSNFFIATSAKYIHYFNLYSVYGMLTSETYQISSTEAFNKQMEFLIGAAIICFVLIIYITFRLCWYILYQYGTESSQNNSNLIDQISTNYIKSFFGFEKMFSFIFRIFMYVLFLPFCEVALRITFKGEYSQYRSYFEVGIGCFTLISSIIIALLIQLHEYDYSLILQDYLSQQRNTFQYLTLCGDFFSCFLLLFDSLVAQQIFHIINTLLRMTHLLIELPYNSKNILILFTQQSIFMFFLQISFIISTSSQKISFSFYLLIISPLCYSLGKWMNQKARHWNTYDLPFLEQEIQSINPLKLNQYIRNSLNLISLPFEVYMNNGLGVKFETIFANHLATCQSSSLSDENSIYQQNKNEKRRKKSDNCFCIKYQDKWIQQNTFEMEKEKSRKLESSIFNYKDKKIIPKVHLMNLQEVQKQINLNMNQIIGRKYRKTFFVQYIANIFENFFDQPHKHSKDLSLLIKPTFIYFLLQIAKTPQKAYQQIASLKEQMKISSLQSQSLLQELINDIKYQFSLFISASPFQNQRLAIQAVFTFDKLFREFKISLRESIQIKQQFYEFLYSDSINLNELVIQSQVCLFSQRGLEKKIQYLFDLNPIDSNLQSIAELYIDLFGFKKRKVRNLTKNSKELTKKKLQRVDFKINIFDSSSCSLFLSLHSKKITHTSDKVAQFFQQSIDSTKLIGEYFTSLFPDFLEISFNHYFESFLDEGNLDLLKIGEFFTFIKSGLNSAIIIPIYIRSKIDVVDFTEFGISMHLAPCDSHQTSIITDQNFLFLASTWNAYQLLSKYIQNEYSIKMTKSTQSTSKDIIQIFKAQNIKNFIPLLYSFDEQTEDKINDFDGYNESLGYKDQRTQKYKIYRSLMVIPTCKEDLTLLNKRIDENSSQLSEYLASFASSRLQYYDITFSLLSFELPKSKQYEKQIDIISHKRIYHEQEISDLASLLKEALSLKYSARVDFSLFNSFQIENYGQEKQILMHEKKLSSTSRKTKSIEQGFSDFGIKEQISQKEQRKEELTEQKSSDFQILSPIIESDYQFMIGTSRQKIKKTTRTEITKFGEYSFIQDTEQKLHQRVDDSMQKLQSLTSRQNEGAHDLIHTIGFDNEFLKNINPISPSGCSTNLFITSPKEKENLLTGSQLHLSLLKSDFKKERFDSQLEDLMNKREHEEKEAQQDISQIKPESAIKRFKMQQEWVQSSTWGDESPSWRNRQTKLSKMNNNSRKHKGSTDMQIVKNRVDKSIEEGGEKLSEKSQNEIEVELNQSFKIKLKHATKLSSDLDIKKARTRQIKDDQESTRTGQNSNFSQQQSLLEMIISSKEPSQIQYSRILGSFSFVAIIVVVCILSASIKSNFDEQWINYINLQIGPSLAESIGQVLRIKEVQAFILIGKLYHYLPSTFNATIQDQFTKEALKQLNRTSKIIGNLEQYHIQEGFEEFLLKNQTRLQYTDVGRPYFPVSLYFGILYSLLQYPINLMMYLVLSEGFGRTFVYINYQTFLTANTQLTALSTQQATLKLEQTEKLLYVSTLIIELISICGVLAIFPIYYIIQSKRQDILNLLATFDPNQLRQLIIKFMMASQLKCLCSQISNAQKFKRKLSLISNKINNGDHSQIKNSTNLNNSYSNKSKRRKISQTTQLPKHSMKINILAFFIFLVILLYSLLNYLFNRNFFKYFSYNIEELALTSQTQSYLSINHLYIYLLSNSYAYQFIQRDVQMVLDSYSGKGMLIEDNQNKITKYEQIDQNFMEDRFQMSDYSEYFLDIIQKDACPILSSSYSVNALENNPLVSIPLCSKISGGLLSKGLAVTLRDFYQKIFTWHHNFVSTIQNASAYFKTIYMWDTFNNFKEFELQYYYIRAILQSQTEFLINQSTNYFNYLISIQDALFIYCLISTFIIYLIIWRKFLSQMSKNIENTTLLLSLIPIQNLLENPYVMSYLNKEKNRTRVNN